MKRTELCSYSTTISRWQRQPIEVVYTYLMVCIYYTLKLENVIFHKGFFGCLFLYLKNWFIKFDGRLRKYINNMKSKYIFFSPQNKIYFSIIDSKNRMMCSWSSLCENNQYLYVNTRHYFECKILTNHLIKNQHNCLQYYILKSNRKPQKAMSFCFSIS